MRKCLSFFCITYLYIFLYTNLVFSQSGWVSQVSGTSVDLNSVFFINENTGFASGGTPGYGVVLKTTNGGTNWNINYTVGAVAFSILFLNSTTGYIAGGYYPLSYILKTTDCGITWISQSTGMPYAVFSIYMTDVNTGYSTGDWGHIIKTTNGGTWFALPSCTGDYLEWLTFTNSSTGYAVGRVGQIIKTTDAGNSWFYLVSYGNWLRSIKFLNSNSGYAVGHYGTILYTNNAGVTWNSVSPGTSYDLNALYFVNSSLGFIAGNNGIILNSTNAGSNWNIQQTGTTNYLLGIHFINASTGYAVGKSGTILKTTTGGLPTIVPTLISPANNSYNVPLTPTLFWTSPSVLYYKVQVSPLSNFSIIADSATVTTNQRTIPPGKLNLSTTYFWRVNATTTAGTGPWSDVWSFATVTTDIKKISSQIPCSFCLYSNYPNPFNPSTKIRFDLPVDTKAKITIFDITGKEISKLIDNELTVGTYEYMFNGENLSSGIYFYKLETKKFTDVKSMVLIK
jgi:photosystem II stability/assembly factor-like uncharacterized protein